MRTDTEIKASVASRDDTEIAYWTSGDGPPIVLVHGTPADHTRWRPLLPYLERQVTVHAIDRRGRGASGDAALAATAARPELGPIEICRHVPKIAYRIAPAAAA